MTSHVCMCVCCVCLLLYTPLLYSTKYLCVWCAVYARTVHVYVLFMLVRVNISVRHCWRCNAVIFIGVWVWLECMRACIVFSSSTTPASNRQTIQADTPAKTKTFMCLCVCVLCVDSITTINAHILCSVFASVIFICQTAFALVIAKQILIVFVCIYVFGTQQKLLKSNSETLF